jgi:WD40 repeat protein
MLSLYHVGSFFKYSTILASLKIVFNQLHVFDYIFQRDLKGHFGDVYSCRFFPSGLVVLSGGVDMQLKIWSAETGQCAATCRGHTAGEFVYSGTAPHGLPWKTTSIVSNTSNSFQNFELL